ELSVVVAIAACSDRTSVVAEPAGDASLPTLAADPPTDEKTPKPSKEEWDKAQEVKIARSTDKACTAKRLREWLRIECKRYEMHVTFIAGTREGVDVHVVKASLDDSGGDAWCVFPMRRGDRRVLLFERVSKWGPAPDAAVTEQWLEGDPAPIV